MDAAKSFTAKDDRIQTRMCRDLFEFKIPFAVSTPIRIRNRVDLPTILQFGIFDNFARPLHLLN